MCADRNAAAHMHNNQAQGFIWLAGFTGVAFCDCLLVQGVENADARELRNPGISCGWHQFVNYYRVNDIGRYTDGIPDFPCKDTAEIGGMLSLYAHFKVGKQRIAYRVSAGNNRF